MDKKSFAYDVRLWDKKGNRYYKTVTLTEGENFWLVFWNLMQETKTTKFHASIITKDAYIQNPFRWSFYN